MIIVSLSHLSKRKQGVSHSTKVKKKRRRRRKYAQSVVTIIPNHKLLRGYKIKINHLISDNTSYNKKLKTALEELFAVEDQQLQTNRSTHERLEHVVQLYRSPSPVPVSTNPAHWWWQKQDTLSLLSALSDTYLCVQATSTPSERVFDTAEDTISPDRLRILPEKADMLDNY